MKSSCPVILLPMLAVAACKPPPTDEADARGTLADIPQGPSAPVDSPDSQNAIWADSTNAGRIIYGNPGEPPMMALACAGKGPGKRFVITRITPADEGAGAFMALIGNSHVARIAVDAVATRNGIVWRGAIAPGDPRLEVLTGRRSVAATVPGGGTITLNASEKPGRLIESCRSNESDEREKNATAQPAL